MTKRKRILVRHDLQTKVVALFLTFACVGVLLQATIVAVAMMRAARSLGPQAAVMFEQLPTILVTSIVIDLVVLVPVMIAGGLFLTFRVAGPVERFETYLRAVARGEETGPCQIRERDELHGLCDAINDALGSLGHGQGADSADSRDSGDEHVDQLAERRRAS